MASTPSTPIHRPFWEQKSETQSRADWDALKLELRQMRLQHAYAKSPYYQASFDAAGVHFDPLKSLADLRRFLFIEKKKLRDRLNAMPPIGDLVAVPERDIIKDLSGEYQLIGELATADPAPDTERVRRFARHLKSITGVSAKTSSCRPTPSPALRTKPSASRTGEAVSGHRSKHG
jgi:hypothetical protein